MTQERLEKVLKEFDMEVWEKAAEITSWHDIQATSQVYHTLMMDKYLGDFTEAVGSKD